MQPLIGAMMMFSVLVPQKLWFAPDQALNVTVKAGTDVSLVLTDFAGKAIESRGPADAADGKAVSVVQLFPTVARPGTYVLYAVAKGAAAGGAPADFLGTPVVIEVKEDKRRGAPPGAMVTRVEPLRYAEVTTDMGPLTCVFYYDVAPNTTDNFLALGEEGFYDGLLFHRVVPGFVIQGGDPRGSDPEHAGTGGPGYHTEAEFSDRPHDRGVLSMARNGDPNERFGEMPRPEFANSAGSQFFVCLDYEKTKMLDHKYTAFGKVVSGMDAVDKIAALPVPDPATGRPDKPPAIQKLEVLAVTKDHNPYAAMFNVAERAGTVPASQPAK